MIADLCNAELPTFVAADLHRVPGLYWSLGDVMSANVDKLTTAVDDILIRMKEMEKKLTTSSTYDDNVNTGHLATYDKVANGESSGNVCTPPTSDPPHQPEKSFASLAADIAASKPCFSFKKMLTTNYRSWSASSSKFLNQGSSPRAYLLRWTTGQRCH